MSEHQEIELTVKEAKRKVRLRDMALNLAKNRDFKALILEGYFKDEAARLVSLSAAAEMKTSREDIFLEIQAISLFQEYMRNMVQFGNIAETELRDHASMQQEMIDEAEAEAES